MGSVWDLMRDKQFVRAQAKTRLIVEMSNWVGGDMFGMPFPLRELRAKELV